MYLLQSTKYNHTYNMLNICSTCIYIISSSTFSLSICFKSVPCWAPESSWSLVFWKRKIFIFNEVNKLRLKSFMKTHLGSSFSHGSSRGVDSTWKCGAQEWIRGKSVKAILYEVPLKTTDEPFCWRSVVIFFYSFSCCLN